MCTTQTNDDTPKTNCAKSTIVTHHLETPKDIATKSGETRVRDTAQPSCKFYVDRREISVPGKNTYFSL